MKFFNKVKGNCGEIIAKNYLKSQKFKIIEQNYKNFCGEVDFVVKDEQTLVFVEVKARESLLFGRPCEAVDKQKQRKIKKVALSYLKFKNVFCHICCSEGTNDRYTYSAYATTPVR